MKKKVIKKYVKQGIQCIHEETDCPLMRTTRECWTIGQCRCYKPVARLRDLRVFYRNWAIERREWDQELAKVKSLIFDLL